MRCTGISRVDGVCVCVVLVGVLQTWIGGQDSTLTRVICVTRIEVGKGGRDASNRGGTRRVDKMQQARQVK